MTHKSTVPPEAVTGQEVFPQSLLRSSALFPFLSIGERLRGVREESGYTVAEMCSLLNTTETHYTGIENGEYSISCDRMITINGIFGIDLNWLIYGEESEPGDTVMYHETALGES